MTHSDPFNRIDDFKFGPLDDLPHARALNMRLIASERARCTILIPYAPHLVGNPETGVIHGGVITTLLDHASGAAIHLALETPTSMATLDFRIDYMKSAIPGEDLRGDTHCYKVTRNVAFVRGVAYHTDPDDPIATSVGTFMLGAVRSGSASLPAQTAQEIGNE